jgi:2-methylcitrate dehydratase PrpD
VLLRDLGTAFRGEALSYKPYPCGRPLHAVIDAALMVRARLKIERPDDIESVTIEADPAGHSDQFGRGPAKRRPAQVVEAQFAQPFLVAIALVHGTVGIAEVDGLGDASVLSLSDRIAGVPPTERVAQYHGATHRRALGYRRGQRSHRVAREAAHQCSARDQVP